MKRSTIIGCFVGLLSLTLSAQTTQPSDSRASSSPTDIGVQKSTVTIQDLLARYNNVGKQAGSVSEHFTIEEQRMLRAYFSNQQPARAANAANTVVFNSSVEAKNIAFTQEQRAAYNRTPLFVAPRALTAEDEAELLAAGQNRLNTNVANNTVIQSRILSDIVPTAGEVETFNPAVGDNFFDPGGPGGENTDGAPGNYPNCNCDTQTTLAGVTEIEFLEFGVNGYFDYLKIYDGADATGTLLYDNSQTGANNGDKVLADMIASNGSATFTSTSGDLFFFFHASGVVNWLGWDVEIVAAGGGGGSGYCTPEGTNSDRFIDNFSTTGGSENISNMGSGFSAGGYGDFYDTATVTQEQEGNVDFSADMEGGTAGFRIWVDWNQDGVFDTTDEVAYASSGYLSNQTGTITVPADALEGDTRMRVVSHWLSTTGDVDPCETGFTYGEFEDYKFTVTSGGGGTFPEPYCGPLTFNNGVEPITLVDVAGISNVSDATLDGSPAHEDFTAIEGDMEEGMTYAIALEGNTGGGFTNSFTVFIDWNQDGILDNDSERYEIGTIVGSTGTDGQQATGDIVVPSGVTAGQTRMRVIKRYTDNYATDSCTPGSSYGQAEDYTINVTGGGGTGGDCEQEHPIAGDGNGGSGSSVDSDFTSAADIVVAAGEDFTLDTIEVSFLTFAPEDAPITANVIYYEDAAGLPGAEIGTETVVPTILSSGEWVNPVAFRFDTSLDMTPFTFSGDAGSDTSYWIGIEMGTATNQATVFWLYTDGAGIEGEPMAQYNAVDGFWTVPEPTREVGYVFSGECTPIGGGGCTPDSLQTLYAGGNNGSPGGAVYFDITVEDSDIDVLSFDLHTEDLGAFTVDVYMFEGTYVGNEADPAIWGTAESTGSGTSAGAGLPSTATLDNTISLSANTTYAVALVFDGTHSHYYTNGDGTNQNYSNADLALDLGSASNTPFTTPIFDPRIFNGAVGYCVDGGGGSGPLTTVYGINNATQDLIGFGVTTPGDTEVFGTSPITVNFENAGAIDPANPTTGYALDNAGEFYSFDVESGFYTSLGNIPGDWVGMEFDRTSGILYAISGADLYTIDPVAISATLVGATGINPADLPIALAIDGAGVGYTYELVNQMFYSVDLTTGTATAIGDIGFDANFGQGMAYDPTTDMVYMSAFNGATFAAEWRSVDLTTGATTFIGNLVNAIGDAQVAWASIGETLAPPACPKPINLAVSNITSTSADLSWDAEPNASSGYIWYVFEAGDNPITDSPIATGTTPSGTTTANATGLSGGLSYDFYVVADCDSDGLSQLAGPVAFATPPACGGKFYDTGGPSGDYEPNANVTTTISPDNVGDKVTVTFTAFNTEAGWDALYVYDGPDASSPIISSGNPATNGGFPPGGYYGTTIPGPFVSSHPSGALTFVFLSDGSFQYSGWEADVTCDMIGVGENTLEGFSFYPNPTNGVLNLTSADNIEKVTLYNVLGQMVITERVNATSSQVDVSKLSTGTYLMKVVVNGKTGTYRVLRQ